jgi:hypothetical protein
MVLFSVYDEDDSFDVVVEESIVSEGKGLLIKRRNDVDYIVGLFSLQKLSDLEFIEKMIS